MDLFVRLSVSYVFHLLFIGIASYGTGLIFCLSVSHLFDFLFVGVVSYRIDSVFLYRYRIFGLNSRSISLSSTIK